MEDLEIKLENKVAIISGAASGLGRQLALDLSYQDMRLILADKDEKGLVETLSLIEESGATALACRTDVTDANACKALVFKAITTFDSIDTLVLCAGISMWARFDEVQDLSIFQRLIDINYLGAVNCIHPALPYLTQSGGSIVTISSLQGIIGIPHHTGYSAAKHALNGFLEALEFEMGDQIHILNVMPGWIKGTNLRSNALSADARTGSHRRHNRDAVSVQDCSSAIIRALKHGEQKLFIPSKLRWIPLGKLIIPGWLKRRIRRAVDEQEAQA